MSSRTPSTSRPPLPRRSATVKRLTTVVALLLALGMVAAGCSNDASTRVDSASDEPSTTAAPVVAAPEVPPGTVLRVGDQLDYLKTILSVSGQDKDLPYTVEYANFVGGPPMLQAFQGGSVDAGFVASTPLIFAQAAGQSIVATAGWAPEGGLGGLIATDPSIEDWADLKGKSVAYQKGTSAEAAVLTGLDEAGLSLSDITTVDVPTIQVTATLKSGAAVAGVTSEPLISKFLAENPDAELVLRPSDITDRGAFLIASTEALDDDARSAAIADYITRLVKAYGVLAKDKEKIAQAIFVGQYGLTPEQASELSENSGVTTFLSLPGDIAKPQQELADRFFAAGQIPAEIDTAKEFDTRFNELVQQTAQEAGVASQGG